jgi:hypothetical protein
MKPLQFYGVMIVSGHQVKANFTRQLPKLDGVYEGKNAVPPRQRGA